MAIYRASQVEVSGEAHYEEVHGKKPAGKGCWLFVNAADNEMIAMIADRPYGKAKKLAAEIAGEKGIRHIKVLP